jgi:hypothetical protein
VSDQDFFFEEDEKASEKPASSAKQSGSKQPTKSAPKSAPKSTPKSAAPQPSGGMELTWTVVALIAVVALLLGVIVGYAIPKGADSLTSDVPAATTSAPQLSPDQLKSGQLPAGHPAIGGAGAPSTATTTGK